MMARNPRCRECGSTDIAVTVEDVRYTDIGGVLPYVVLVDMEVRTCEKCRNRTVRVPQISALEDKLRDGLLESNKRYGANEVRFLRTYLGYSKKDFAQLMAVAYETAVKWETGATSIGRQAELLLREYARHGRKSRDYRELDKKHQQRAVRRMRIRSGEWDRMEVSGMHAMPQG